MHSFAYIDIVTNNFKRDLIKLNFHLIKISRKIFFLIILNLQFNFPTIDPLKVRKVKEINVESLDLSIKKIQLLHSVISRDS